jgi:hypothetical protein
MFSGVMADLARERASMARDMELITESVKDAKLQEAIMIYENCDKEHRLYTEDAMISPEEQEEIKHAIEQIPDTDDDAPAQIERILNASTDDMSVDQMLGITAMSEPSHTDVLDGLRTTANEMDKEEDECGK